MKPNRSKTIVICILVSVAILAACSRKDDVEQIRNVIRKGTGLAEKHEIGKLLDLATPDFIAQPGNHDTGSVRGILFMAFQHYGRLKIHHPKPSVEMADEPGGAIARLYFVIVSQDKPLPGLKELYDDPQAWLEAASAKADAYQLDLNFVKHDGDWLVKQARLVSLGL